METSCRLLCDRVGSETRHAGQFIQIYVLSLHNFINLNIYLAHNALIALKKKYIHRNFI